MKGPIARAKWVLSALLITAALLVGKWFVASQGSTLAQQKQPDGTPHSVTLHWQPSATEKVRYNVYRGTSAKNHPDKLNSSPLDTLTFTDTKVEKGKTYYYVTRSIDSKGHESLDSNETVVVIPDK
jgi:fibronectin type 3 domain-containing protein